MLRAAEGGTKPNSLNCLLEAVWDTSTMMEPMYFGACNGFETEGNSVKLYH